MRRFLSSVALVAAVCFTCAQHGEIELKSFTALPSGSLQDGLGRVRLKITTNSEDARKLFEQGLCYYHAFHWTEAQRSFRDAVKVDPTCAMGWWGLHITLMNPWNRSNAFKAEREGAIDRAVRLMDNCTVLEQDLIRAWKIWSSGSKEGYSDFEKAMLEICERHPKEVEPRVLMAGILVQTDLSSGYSENGEPDREMKIARKLAGEALKIDSQSTGAHHYWIHACEGSPKPEDALASADMLGKIAFKSGHLIHMPGHIYYRCGLYDKAVESFGNGKKADEVYNTAVGTANGNWNYYHNNDFYIAALVEVGKKSEALQIATELSKNSLSFVLWRTSDFAKLGEAIESKSVKMGPLAASYVKAILALDSGNLEAATTAVEDVKEKCSSSDKYDSDQFFRIETAAILDCLKNDGDNVEALVNELEIVMRKQPYAEPPDYGRPAAEGIGMALLKTNKTALAKRCFELALKDRANTPYSVYGLAMVAEKQGDSATARKLYKKVADALKNGDKDLAIFVNAKAKSGS